MRVDGSLKSLIQGISQQPPRTRLPGQCTAQENMSSNPVSGLTRRPPLHEIMELFEGDEAQFYNFKYGTQGFLVATEPGSLRVFDMTGAEVTVTEEDDAFDYLDGGQLTFTTLENEVYIANRTKVCAMVAGDFADFRDYGCIINIFGGQYGRTYTVDVTYRDNSPAGALTTTSASHTTPDGSSVAHGAQIATDYIANALATALDTALDAEFSVTTYEDVIYVTWANARTDQFTVTVSDGQNGVNIAATNNQVSSLGRLPKFAPQNYHVTVTGDSSSGADDFYLAFSVTPDANGDTPLTGAGMGRAGIWVETVKNQTPYKVDAETMPIILEYDEDLDEFTCKLGEWAGRQVGDEESNADPSFIGRTINHLTYFQGRLVALAGPAVIMSRPNNPLDFWIETATTQTEGDAIDIESTAVGVTEMLRAVPHNRDLIVFAEGAQFIVFGRNRLTPQNASLVLTTSFEANLYATPVSAGRNIFFGINYGAYTSIREFYTEGSQDINDARNITQHVIEYIPGTIQHIAASSNFDALLVQSTGNMKHLYAYEYIWVDDRKAQSSWSRWNFAYDVEYYFFDDSVIYIVYKVGDNYVLGSLDLNMQDDAEMTYQVKLDRKIYHDTVNDSLTLFYIDPPAIEDMIFVQGEGCPFPGLRVEVDDYDEGTMLVTFKTDMGGGTVIYGERYLSEYEPTMPFVKDQDGVRVGTGKLVISKFYINVQQSGSFYATIQSPYRDDQTIYFTGRSVGNPNSVVGEAAIVDASHVVPFRDDIDNAVMRLHTDSHEPLTVLDIEWLGQYTKRGRRITQGE